MGPVGDGGDIFQEALGGSWGITRDITRPQRSETMGLRGLRHMNMTVVIIPALMQRIPSELRS